MRISLKSCLSVLGCVALFATLGLGYSSDAKAVESARVTAIVLCLGAPQGEAEVTLGERSEETKANGACVFDVSPGAYTISTSIKRGSKSINVTLQPGEIRQIILEVCQPEHWPQIWDYAGPSKEQK